GAARHGTGRQSSSSLAPHDYIAVDGADREGWPSLAAFDQIAIVRPEADEAGRQRPDLAVQRAHADPYVWLVDLELHGADDGLDGPRSGRGAAQMKRDTARQGK